MNDSDTIVSIATGMTDAGIGIVRISGKKAIGCADKLLVNKKKEHDLIKRAPNTIRFGYVLDETGAILDEALVSVLRAPYSYTGEDMVEINVHGGRLVMEEVLRLLLLNGKEAEGGGKVRLAEPGEYTKRAFLAGKMDLTKAEAVQDIISSDNAFALKNAAKQLSGVLRDEIMSLREKLLHETAFLEAALDDPDVYGEELKTYRPHLKQILQEISADISRMLAHFDEGVLRKDGFSCVIIGRVNAGKSSLLNALTGTDRAIVTSVPGTTRDIVAETVRIDDALVHLSDTAGIRSTADPVEEEGIRRAYDAAKDAFLTLLVTDASADITDEENIALLEEAAKRRTFLLLNKADLVSGEARDKKQSDVQNLLQAAQVKELPYFFVSAKTGEGLAVLREKITALIRLDENAPKEAFYLTNARHKEAMLSALYALHHVTEAIGEGVSEEFFLVDLMDAYSALSGIIGEAVSEDLIDKIFADFCMGK